MQTTATSPSFPNGVGPLRSEATVRALRPAHKSCPFCNSDPELATQRHGYFLVGCTADECACNPQVSGTDLSAAWAKWNARAVLKVT